MVCAHRKLSHRGMSAGLRCIAPKDRPYDMISMDIQGPLPITDRGNKFLLIFNDYATRSLVAIPLKHATGPEVAEALLFNVILHYGPPSVILSDKGSHFLNEVMYSLLSLFTIYQVTSSGYRPQTAGITERINYTTATGLASYCKKNQRGWDVLIPFIVFQYVTQHNPVLGASPFFLLHGYDPVLPSDFGLLPEDANTAMADRQRNTVAKLFNEARQHAHETLTQSQRKTEQRFNATHRPPPDYKIGDYVMAYQPSHPARGTIKLASQVYTGPYRIMARYPSQRTFQLVHACTGETRDAHIDNLKPYHYSEDLRPGSMPGTPPPHPSPQVEQR